MPGCACESVCVWTAAVCRRLVCLRPTRHEGDREWSRSDKIVGDQVPRGVRRQEAIVAAADRTGRVSRRMIGSARKAEEER